MADIGVKPPVQYAPPVPTSAGEGLMVTVTDAVLLQLFASVPVTVYTVVTVGVATVTAPVADDRLPDGDHE